jgi:hypothetical protein
LGLKEYHLPKFDVPAGFSTKSYLHKLCEDGLKHRYGSKAEDKVVRERLNYELDVIHNMGFDAYFLIVWDLCRYAEQEGIWYSTRGSAQASIVAYTLDISNIEPIEYGLIFERFLNPGRISMPDIDSDFADTRRDEGDGYGERYSGFHGRPLNTCGVCTLGLEGRAFRQPGPLPFLEARRANGKPIRPPAGKSSENPFASVFSSNGPPLI